MRVWEAGKVSGAYCQMMDRFPRSEHSTLPIPFVGADFLEIGLAIKGL
jgi:hypothetical protein